MIYARESSLIQVGSSRAIQAAAGNKLIVDSILAFPDSPADGEHWYVDTCSLVGIDPNNNTSFANPGNSGIFIAPPGTVSPAVELVSTVGSFNSLQPLATDGAGAWWGGVFGAATFTRIQAFQPFILPAKCFIRGVWDSGPGAFPTNGSTLTLFFTFFRRKNGDCPQEVLVCP